MKKKIIIISILVLAIAVGAIFVINHFWPNVINKILGRDPITYSLTVDVNDTEMGTAVASAERGAEGDLITLEAKPNYGYVFVAWYNGSMMVGTERKITIAMPDEDTVITAHFTQDIYDIRMDSMNPGYLDSNSGNYKYLSTINLVANEIEGYIFAGWYVDNILISNKNNFDYVVTRDAVIYAEYYSTAINIFSYPVAQPSDYNTPLRDIELIGGQADVLGTFQWRSPDQVMLPGYEYIVVFDPVLEIFEPVHFMLTIPLKTEVLPAPSISINNQILSWNAIDGAIGYTVTINDSDIIVDANVTTYELPTEVGEYYVSVKANGDGNQVKDSLYSTVIRYTAYAPTKAPVDFANKSPVYENGVLKKYAGSFTLDPELDGGASSVVSKQKNIIVSKDSIKFKIDIDIAEYISKKAKSQLLKLNNKVDMDATIRLTCDIELLNPVFYAEVNTDFPESMEDLAFGLEFSTMTSTVVDISIDGEFVDPQLRRSTLHLLFLELVGLPEPIYVYDNVTISIPYTYNMLAVDLSMAFDAVGAIAAGLNIQKTEEADYFMGIHILEDGSPVFNGQFSRTVKEETKILEISGETDVEINFLRVSVSLLVQNHKEKVAVTRLNIDLFNLSSDLSGDIKVVHDGVSDETTKSIDVSGAYRFFGQITFEYYLEIKLKFSFLPIENFSFKLMDGTLLLSDWEYFKGGIPKQAYRDEAIHKSTPVSATDGEYFYYKDLDGILRRKELDSDFSNSIALSDIGNAEIVDIDNYYIYVQSENNLRRVGLTAGTERTVIPGISRVVGSNRTHIFYTEIGSENVIKEYLRMDFEGKAKNYLTLPRQWHPISMRYDYNLNADIIYAEKSDGSSAYFVYDGAGFLQYSTNTHAYWYKINFNDDITAYYTKDDDGDILDAFITFSDGGITQDDNVHSIGVTPLGIFVTKDNPHVESGKPYVMGLYTIVDGHGRYYRLCDIDDKYAANRVTHEGDMSYFVDVSDDKLNIFKTDGTAAYPIVSPMIEVTTKNLDTLECAILKDKLFIYEHSVGHTKVIYTVDVKTLIESPYLLGQQHRVFDKGEPDHMTFEMGSDHAMTAIYLSNLSDEEIEKLSKEISDLKSQYDTIRKLLKEETDYFAKIDSAAEKINKIFEDHPGIFSCLSESQSTSITIPFVKLFDLSYGMHSGYVITDAGYIPISINVIDSRKPSLITSGTPIFDKNSPEGISFDVILYDDKLDITNATEGKDFNLTYRGGDISTITFSPAFLMTLPYGIANISHNISLDEKLVFPIEIIDTRTPKDSVFSKTFDKSYSKDVVFNFNLYDEGYVTAISGNGIKQNQYTVNHNQLIISEEFLLSCNTGVWEFSMTTLEGDVPITITIIETLAPEADCKLEHILGGTDTLTITYIPNDAQDFNLKINNILLKEWEYSFDYQQSKITVFNDFLEDHIPYGDVSISIESYIRSGDEVYVETDNMTVLISDQRLPTANTDYISYHMQTNAPDIEISTRLYNHEITSLSIDGIEIPYHFSQLKADKTVDYRGGNIVIAADTITKNLNVGAHTIKLTIGTHNFEIGLYVSDQRLPEPLDTKLKFNISSPMSTQFAIGLYNHEIVSVSGYDIGDGDYLIRPFAENASVKVISITAAFLKGLNPSAGDSLVFRVTTDVNAFDITVVCYENPKIVLPPPEAEYNKPYVPEETPVSASRPEVIPSTMSSDYANPVDLEFVVDYGENNSFGAISRGFNTLVEGRHYVLTENGTTKGFILKAGYLDQFEYGTHTFALQGALGKSDTFAISVYDSRSPYLENEVTIEYDRFVGGSKQFDAVMYDSAVRYVIVNGTRHNSGFSSGSTKITLFDSLLSTLAIGEHTITIGFNDCDATITVKVIVNDTGLYLGGTTYIDKSLFIDDITEVFVPWTLYEGSVTSVTSDKLSIGFYTRDGFMLSGFKSADYGTYDIHIVANGYSFIKKIIVYDSRKPHLDKEVYEFDKADYEYTLNPSVAAQYDIPVHVTLYDESLDGEDAYLNQTITGGGITYEDYERTSDTYFISYLYLFRLPVGTYDYRVRTTDGTLNFKIVIKDSHTPQLKQESPIIYDYDSEADLEIMMELFGEPESSLSYITFLGSEFSAVENELYQFTHNSEGDDVLIIKADFFKRSDIYYGYEYRFRIATTTERVLDFYIKLDDGPRMPCTVTFVYEPMHVYPDGTIEPDISIPPQELYYGDCAQEPVHPTHDYYVFEGFFTEKVGGVKFDFSTPIHSDTVLFPRWTPKTYNINLISDGNKINTIPVKYLANIPAFATPSKTGYNFIRWTSDEDNLIRFNLTTMPHEDINVYAEWKIASYKVIFKDAGGAVLKTETVQAFENATPPSNEDMYIDEYHQFLGWDGSYENVTSNRTLTARYEITKFNITYHLDGGTLPSDAPTQYTIDGGVKLKTPTKRGYAFQGWYTDPEFINMMTVIPSGLPDGVTLYAKWEVGVYGVILDRTHNGIEYNYSYAITNDRVSITYGTAYTLPILKTGNQGYAFMGWYSGRGGTGTQYTDANGNSLNNWQDLSIINLYPHVVDLLTLTDVKIDNGTLSFKINQNLGTGVEITSINLIKHGMLDDCITDIQGAGIYSFTDIEPDVEHEVVVSFDYTLENAPSTMTTTRSFKIKSEISEPIKVVEGQTVAEILVKNDNFASYSIDSVTVYDARNELYAAHVYDPSASSRSAINVDDGWVYLTGLVNNSHYFVTINYTYTLHGYAGTYSQQMICDVLCNKTLNIVPTPTLNVSATRYMTSRNNDIFEGTDEYFTYNLTITPSDVYLENEVRILRYEILNSDGSVKNVYSYDKYLDGNKNVITISIDRNTLANGSVYSYRICYTYNTQDGAGYIEELSTSEQFIADLHDSYTSDGCIIDETPVLMADGSYKRAEDVKIGDLLMVWSFEKGEISVAPVTAIHTASFDEIVYLKFSDGSIVGIADSHAFYSIDYERYVNISANNVSDFVGTYFAALDDGKMSNICLVGYEIVNETRVAYTIATAGGFNHFASNLLCALPFVNVLNMFEFDGMQYDMELLLKDIETYGLLPYEVASDLITYDQFVALNGPYLSVAIGKGLYTIEELRAIIIDYYNEITM